MTKNISLIILVLGFLSSLTLAFGQTKVIKRSMLKSNDYGVNYFLPKTALEVTADFEKVEQKAGPYYKYAEKYLGVKNTISENNTFYELKNVTVESKGIPDKEKSYVVELKSGTFAPFVYLTESGLICTINAEYEVTESKSNESANASVKSGVIAESMFTEEYLQAGSVAKMAEVAAKQIYKIRESRMDILTGEAENAPRDGVAMQLVLQQLESQEKALVELFTGTSVRALRQQFFTIDPQDNLNKEVIFRFSKYLGVVDKDDLSGSPVYMNLTKKDSEELFEPAKKEIKGIVYNVPGQGTVEIFYGTQRMFDKVLPITQFGITQVLANPLFEDKKAPVKVYFYPETGGVKQILQ